MAAVVYWALAVCRYCQTSAVCTLAQIITGSLHCPWHCDLCLGKQRHRRVKLARAPSLYEWSWDWTPCRPQSVVAAAHVARVDRLASCRPQVMAHRAGGRAWWVRGGRGGSGELVGRVGGVGGGQGGLPSMGSYRVGHDWSDLAAAAGTRWVFVVVVVCLTVDPWPASFQPPGSRVAFVKRACLSSPKVGMRAEGRASWFCFLLPGSHGFASLGFSLSDGGYSITYLVWFSWGLD